MSRENPEFPGISNSNILSNFIPERIPLGEAIEILQQVRAEALGVGNFSERGNFEGIKEAFVTVGETLVLLNLSASIQGTSVALERAEPVTATWQDPQREYKVILTYPPTPGIMGIRRMTKQDDTQRQVPLPLRFQLSSNEPEKEHDFELEYAIAKLTNRPEELANFLTILNAQNRISLDFYIDKPESYSDENLKQIASALKRTAEILLDLYNRQSQENQK